MAVTGRERQADSGFEGLIVSNHGGRQLDGAVATLDALPPIIEVVGKRIPVLLDSGIRSGSDVLEALARGATADLLGRPYVYGLAIAGEAGVREVLLTCWRSSTLLSGSRAPQRSAIWKRRR